MAIFKINDCVDFELVFPKKGRICRKINDEFCVVYIEIGGVGCTKLAEGDMTKAEKCTSEYPTEADCDRCSADDCTFVPEPS